MFFKILAEKHFFWEGIGGASFSVLSSPEVKLMMNVSEQGPAWEPPAISQTVFSKM